MSLLIHIHCDMNILDVVFFTFHNVSINSAGMNYATGEFDLFTFHNVSINSRKQTQQSTHYQTFTFHNVSINS